MADQTLTSRNPPLDRSRPVALYYQIAGHLREEIQARGLRPGDHLTTEEELQSRFGVSRATARRALEELVDEGLVERVTGKGTFVAHPKVKVELPSLLSFTEEITRLGMTPASRVLGVRWVEAPEEAAHHLEVEPGTRLLEVRRVRLADGEPIVYLVDYLPDWLGLEETADFTGSLYALLESLGHRVKEAVHTIEAGVSGRNTAGPLGVEPGQPVLCFRRTTYDDAGRPIVFERAACRGDRYSYTVRLYR